MVARTTLATNRRCKDHTLRARPADADQITKRPLGRFRATPDRAHEHGSDHMDHHKHAEELATLLLATLLLQPPYGPNGPNAAKSCEHTVRSGCQLQMRARGGFWVKAMLI